jgi:hypothetical protein
MKHEKRCQWLLSAICFFLTTIGSQAAFAAYFVTYCQEEYEDDWQDELHYSWEHCTYFNNELDDTDTKVAYRNLHSAKDEFELLNDENGLERGNLAYVKTHGGRSCSSAKWAMWNEDVLAYTNRNSTERMYLGNEDRMLSILSSYACWTHDIDDGDTCVWNRWAYTFKGGLRISTGSHGDLWDGPTTDECGEDYADDLQGGMTIKNAWKSALEDWATDQDVAVFASGMGESNCVSRKNNMTWQNFGNYSRLRDSSVKYLCWTIWRNL